MGSHPDYSGILLQFYEGSKAVIYMIILPMAIIH